MFIVLLIVLPIVLPIGSAWNHYCLLYCLLAFSEAQPTGFLTSTTYKLMINEVMGSSTHPAPDLGFSETTRSENPKSESQ